MLPSVLPPAPSWFPGHMSRFTRLLPAFLSRTDIVIELRDARLPLTSINPTLESAISRWQMERRNVGARAAENKILCERIVILGKKDLVGQWGLPPFEKAMKTVYPDQHIHFTSHTQPRTIRDLSNLLISMASRHAASMPEVNVLVVGMPNVGKSTLLNSLRNHGIAGPTPKALRTGAHPGITRALSTRLKLSLEPLIYAFDSPGVMFPFLGRGDIGAERGVKLALIAGLKEGMYDIEALTAYLLYRLWVLNPQNPVYMTLLPPSTPFPTDVYEFLDRLAARLGMIKRGSERDTMRAATWFIRWWREEGGLASAQADVNLKTVSDKPTISDVTASPELNSLDDSIPKRMGWGFDFEWGLPPSGKTMDEEAIQKEMENTLLTHAKALKEEQESGEMSETQHKKRERSEKIAKRLAKWKAAGR
ncbi:hypothetical protein M422DRAFT_213973 [Sphaerobolus stellatus SS14]|uniref:G domain-containing protein n=1 Tax=Sphaerobolus stellatus (strain SS14) TaxID=990650 RepID=A0A0C9V3V2_SPHS4|nr:hypothetical protein M422DRAFT_213973 [Sphaerobolus stellatus SS14]